MAGEHGGTGEATLETAPLAEAADAVARIEAARWYVHIRMPAVVVATGDTTLQAIPLVMAAEAAADLEPIRPWYARVVVPRIVDYLIVAAFMFFWL
ncbi:MAG: hypothetical protein IT548_04385 [Alphaproteobacteria bacterium]|nr:hypothetical protein [Alphaproteobacteria bacterium]